MQIITQGEAILLGLKENTGKEDRKFYEVSLEQNDSVCSLSTSADVYDFAKIPENKIAKYKPCVFTFAFDTRFNSYRVIAIASK